MDNYVHSLFGRYTYNEKSTRRYQNANKKQGVYSVWLYLILFKPEFLHKFCKVVFYFHLFTCHMVIKALCDKRFYLFLGGMHDQMAFLSTNVTGKKLYRSNVKWPQITSSYPLLLSSKSYNHPNLHRVIARLDTLHLDTLLFSCTICTGML